MSAKKITLRDKKQMDFLFNALPFMTVDDSDLVGLLYKFMQKKNISSKVVDLLQPHVSEELEDDFYDIFERKNIKNRPKTLRYIKSEFTKYYDANKNKRTDGYYEKKLRKLQISFRLTDIECELLFALYLIDSDNLVGNVFEECNNSCGFSRYKNQKVISVISGISEYEVSRSLARNASLQKTMLIEDDLDLNSDLKMFFAGHEDCLMSDKNFKEYKDTPLPLDYHEMEQKHLDSLENIILNKSSENGINILIHGVPGTGKSEFVRSFCQHINYTTYEICSQPDNVKWDPARMAVQSLITCHNVINNPKSVIVMDECDIVLESLEKGLLNSLIDDSKSIIFWITNSIQGMHSSTARRFDYSIQFKALNYSKRKKIWQNQLEVKNLQHHFTNSQIEKFAADYELNAGEIATALKNLAFEQKAVLSASDLTENILSAKSALYGIGNNKKLDNKHFNAPNYCLDGLNIKGNLEHILKITDNFNTKWGKDEDCKIQNLNILLYGAPGSGKTEFAKYLARRTNRKLIVKSASALLSKWVGETEQNIHEAFVEAETEQAILFIDEADSFFSNRESANHSWEVTQVNEILTNMENFKGVLICATNFKKLLDSAAIRRFSLKLEFDYLLPAGVLALYNSFFSDLIKAALKKTEEKELLKLQNVTPGDFKVVYQKALLLDDSELNHADLIRDLKLEIGAKNESAVKRIGFY